MSGYLLIDLKGLVSCLVLHSSVDVGPVYIAYRLQNCQIRCHNQAGICSVPYLGLIKSVLGVHHFYL